MLNRLCSGLRIALPIIAISCAGDDINLTCPDPLGADARTIKIYSLSCFQPDFAGCLEFRLNGTSAYIQSVYITGGDSTEAPLITDIGEVTCLGEVAQRPTDGWRYSATATEKHGYVFKMKDGSLGRLFIESWETSGAAITNVNFTRQYPY
jgi:hypothetical protein